MHQWGTNSEDNCPTLGKVEFVSFKLISAGMAGIGGGLLMMFLGGGVLPGPENPYPISDKNIRFSIPYFRPDSQNVYPVSDPVICCDFGQWMSIEFMA